MNTSTVPATLTMRDRALVLDLLESRRVISSGPYRGGLTSSRYLVNCTVGADFAPLDVQAAIRAELQDIGVPLHDTTCCLTAVDVWNHTQAEAIEGQVRATALVTAGLGNLSSPGLSAISFRSPSISVARPARISQISVVVRLTENRPGVHSHTPTFSVDAAFPTI